MLLGKCRLHKSTGWTVLISLSNCMPTVCSLHAARFGFATGASPIVLINPHVYAPASFRARLENDAYRMRIVRYVHDLSVGFTQERSMGEDLQSMLCADSLGLAKSSLVNFLSYHSTANRVYYPWRCNDELRELARLRPNTKVWVLFLPFHRRTRVDVTIRFPGMSEIRKTIHFI